jgi:hypothetical protein
MMRNATTNQELLTGILKAYYALGTFILVQEEI